MLSKNGGASDSEEDLLEVEKKIKRIDEHVWSLERMEKINKDIIIANSKCSKLVIGRNQVEELYQDDTEAINIP